MEAGEYVYSLKEGVILRCAEDVGRYWVFDTVGGEHYSVNREAYQILGAIAAEGLAGAEVLAASLAGEYEVTEEAACKDVEDLLSELVGEGIVLRRDKP